MRDWQNRPFTDPVQGSQLCQNLWFFPLRTHFLFPLDAPNFYQNGNRRLFSLQDCRLCDPSFPRLCYIPLGAFYCARCFVGALSVGFGLKMRVSGCKEKDDQTVIAFMWHLIKKETLLNLLRTWSTGYCDAHTWILSCHRNRWDHRNIFSQLYPQVEPSTLSILW